MTRFAPMVFALMCSACIGTETTNPPFDETVDFERTLVFGESVQTTPDDPTVRIGGEPGAVEPAEGRLLARTLEGDYVEASASVAGDGSFLLVVPVRANQAFRLEHRFDGRLGTVAEMRFSAESGLRRTATTLPCVSLDTKALELPAGGTAVTLQNDCAFAVERERATLRNPATEVVLVDEGALSLAPGESATIELSAMGPRIDNVAVIAIREPEVTLRAVSIRAPTSP